MLAANDHSVEIEDAIVHGLVRLESGVSGVSGLDIWEWHRYLPAFEFSQQRSRVSEVKIRHDGDYEGRDYLTAPGLRNSLHTKITKKSAGDTWTLIMVVFVGCKCRRADIVIGYVRIEFRFKIFRPGKWVVQDRIVYSFVSRGDIQSAMKMIDELSRVLGTLGVKKRVVLHTEETNILGCRRV